MLILLSPARNFFWYCSYLCRDEVDYPAEFGLISPLWICSFAMTLSFLDLLMLLPPAFGLSYGWIGLAASRSLTIYYFLAESLFPDADLLAEGTLFPADGVLFFSALYSKSSFLTSPSTGFVFLLWRPDGLVAWLILKLFEPTGKELFMPRLLFNGIWFLPWGCLL